MYRRGVFRDLLSTTTYVRVNTYVFDRLINRFWKFKRRKFYFQYCELLLSGVKRIILNAYRSSYTYINYYYGSLYKKTVYILWPSSKQHKSCLSLVLTSQISDCWLNFFQVQHEFDDTLHGSSTRCTSSRAHPLLWTFTISKNTIRLCASYTYRISCTNILNSSN